MSSYQSLHPDCRGGYPIGRAEKKRLPVGSGAEEAKQSRRGPLPQVHAPKTLPAHSGLQADWKIILGRREKAESAQGIAANSSMPESIAILSVRKGGWKMRRFSCQTYGWISAPRPRILRTRQLECSMAAIMYRWRSWNENLLRSAVVFLSLGCKTINMTRKPCKSSLYEMVISL